MVMYSLRPATEADAHELAPMLRQEDRAEVLALLGPVDPVQGLLQSLESAQEAWTARDAEGRIICMAGVSPLSLIGQTGVPWLLGSDLVATHRRAFMLETRAMIGRWLGLFPVLRNVVDARYAAAIRWLTWLGFDISEPLPFGFGMFCVARKEAA